MKTDSTMRSLPSMQKVYCEAFKDIADSCHAQYYLRYYILILNGKNSINKYR